MSKDNQKKARSTKKRRYTAREVAEISGVSESYVKQLRAGMVSTNTVTARIVLAADELLDESSNKLLKEVERVLSNSNQTTL